MRFAVAALVAMTFMAAPLEAREAKRIKSPDRVVAGQGIVRLSLRSQAQLTETLFLYFLREGGDPARAEDVLQFERGAGVPIAGSNATESLPRLYSVAPGRYRLIAHIVACKVLPPEGAACFRGFVSFPTQRYAGDVPAFEVVEGQFTDAGEYVLELPSGFDGGLKAALREIDRAEIRWRPIAAAVDSGLAQLRAAQPSIPGQFSSNIKCERLPDGSKPLLHPFEC